MDYIASFLFNKNILKFFGFVKDDSDKNREDIVTYYDSENESPESINMSDSHTQ